MRTRSSSNLPIESPPKPSTSNLKRRNRRRSKQPFILEESPVDTMADQHLLHACPRHGFTELHQLDTFYNALNPADQHSLNSAAGGNLLERRTQDVLTIIENKSKIAKLTRAANQQTSVVTTAMTAIIKHFQATPPPASVKAVEEICVTCGVVPLSELEKIMRMNEANMKSMQTQINKVKNELRNEMKNSIQASMSDHTNKLKNMMASFFQMNTASNSSLGSLPSNTISNPKGELKAITTQSGIVLDGPFVPIPPPFINLEDDERIEKTLTNHDLAGYTIKVPPPLVQKSKPHSQRNFVMHQRDPLYPNIPYPSRMHKQKQQEKDEVQIHKFWQMFKQLHINITLADALILIPKYQKMLKALLSNKEKLLELVNTPLNENYSAIILKKLPEKLGDPGKFLIPYGFSELKCKALANLGASINLMPLSVWKKVSYLNQPQKESINMINIYDDSSEDFLEELFTTNHQSGNPTFSSHPKLTSPKVKDDVFDPEGGNVQIEKLLDLDSTKDLRKKC
nr:reverse transcriptase domain-containing protein [Tanacetum cinerariifolium]